MKILCIGDIHIQPSNISSQCREFIEKLFKYLEEISVDIIILMGDILHTHETLKTQAINYARDFFLKLRDKAPLYVLVGNHDLIRNSEFMTENHWMNVFKGYSRINIIDKVTEVVLEGYKLILSPYVPDGRFIEALDTVEWKDCKCIFGHQLLDGVKMGSIVVEGVEKWEETYPLLISGHIHDKQRPQPNMYYTGSAMQHAFGESSDKTLALLTLVKEEVKIEEINLDLSKKLILYLDTDELTSLGTREFKDNVEYKLSISGSEEEFRAFKTSHLYKKLRSKNIRIIFKHKRSFITEQKKTLQTPSKKQFVDILKELVDTEDNCFLEDIFESIILGRKEREFASLVKMQEERIKKESLSKLN